MSGLLGIFCFCVDQILIVHLPLTAIPAVAKLFSFILIAEHKIPLLIAYSSKVNPVPNNLDAGDCVGLYRFPDRPQSNKSLPLPHAGSEDPSIDPPSH